MELVSIIIPFCNAKPYLEKCLDGIISQTYPNLEILLIDDGSTDGSAELSDDLAKKDTRITVIHSPNLGVSNARNIGIRESKGEFIVFVDSDDLVEPDMVQVYVEHMIRYDVDLVVSSFYEHYINKNKVVKYNMLYAGVVKSDHFLEDVWEESFFGKNRKKLHPSCWGKLFKRSIITGRNIQFDITLKYGEDILFLFDYMMVIKNAYFLHDFYPYYYIIHDHSVTKKFETNRYWRWKYLIAKYREKLGKDYLEQYNRIYCLMALDSYYPLSKVSVPENRSYLKQEINKMLDDNDLEGSFQYLDETFLSIRERFFLYLMKNRHVNVLLLFLFGKNILANFQK